MQLWRFQVCALLLFCGSCTGGSLETGPGDGGPDADSDGGRDSGAACGAVVCGTGQTCVDGRCVADDCCEAIVCPNPGDVCRACECVAGGADSDGDGFIASEDCDDTDPSVIPGSERPCYSECGAPGNETCLGGTWVDCNAPTSCDCAPGDEEEIDCGMCGTAARSCLGDGTWGATSACGGEGECMAGADQSQGCGWCGTETRSCGDDCSWSDWGACTDEGVCAVGTTEGRWCGSCGSQPRTCDAHCAWGGWGGCTETGTDRSSWRRVNDLGVDEHLCPTGFALSLGTRELGGDWRLDEMAVDCCDQVPAGAGSCTWTPQHSIAAVGEPEFLCPPGNALAGIETEDFAGDSAVDYLRARCCPTTAPVATCAWTTWLGITALGERWQTCAAGMVATGLQTREDSGDWLVDGMRVRCCT